MLFTSIVRWKSLSDADTYVFAIDLTPEMVHRIKEQYDWLYSNSSAVAGEFEIDKSRARFVDRSDFDEYVKRDVPDWARGGDDPLDYYEIMTDYGIVTQEYLDDEYSVPIDVKLHIWSHCIGFKFTVKSFADHKEVHHYLETAGLGYNDFFRSTQ